MNLPANDFQLSEIKKLEDLAGKMGEVIFSSSVFSSQHKNQRVLLILTNAAALLYKQASIDAVASVLWEDLTNYEYNKKSILLSSGKETINITLPNTKDLDNINYKISCIILRYFSPEELSKRKIQLTIGKLSEGENGLILSGRFRSHAYANGIQLTQAMIDEFDLVVRTHSDAANLRNNEEIAKCFDSCVYALNNSPYVKSFQLPSLISIDPYHKFADIFSTDNNFKHILIDDIAGSSFSYFCKALDSPERSKIHLKLDSLTLKNAKLTKDQLILLSRVVEKRNFESLSLINSISNSDILEFCDLFSNFLSLESTKLLRLEGISNLDLSYTLPICQKLTVLSLANCNLEIPKNFNSMASLTFPNLLLLNLSGNIISEDNFNLPLDFTTRACPKLYRIDFDSIDWPAESFTLILRQISNWVWENGVFCSFNFISISENSLLSFSSALHSFRFFPFTGLSWENSPISSGVVSFFEFCTNLRYLSISGSVIPDNPNFNSSSNENVFSHFANFISNAPSLKTLIARGTDLYIIGEKSSQIFEAAQHSHSLESIDLSFNKIGSKGLKALSDLCNNNSKIKYIGFEDIGDKSTLSLDEFFDSIYKSLPTRREPLFISFPYKDINYFYSQNIINRQQFRAAIQRLNDLSNYDPGKNQLRQIEPRGKLDPMEIPYDFYQLNLSLEFPFFIKEWIFEKRPQITNRSKINTIHEVNSLLHNHSQESMIHKSSSHRRRHHHHENYINNDHRKTNQEENDNSLSVNEEKKNAEIPKIFYITDSSSDEYVRAHKIKKPHRSIQKPTQIKSMKLKEIDQMEIEQSYENEKTQRKKNNLTTTDSPKKSPYDFDIFSSSDLDSPNEEYHFNKNELSYQFNGSKEILQDDFSTNLNQFQKNNDIHKNEVHSSDNFDSNSFDLSIKVIKNKKRSKMTIDGDSNKEKMPNLKYKNKELDLKQFKPQVISPLDADIQTDSERGTNYMKAKRTMKNKKRISHELESQEDISSDELMIPNIKQNSYQNKKYFYDES